MNDLTEVKAKVVAVDEAARMLGCSERHVRRLAEEGRIASWQPSAWITLFSRAEVEQYAQTRRQRGRRRTTPIPG